MSNVPSSLDFYLPLSPVREAPSAVAVPAPAPAPSQFVPPLPPLSVVQALSPQQGVALSSVLYSHRPAMAESASQSMAEDEQDQTEAKRPLDDAEKDKVKLSPELSRLLAERKQQDESKAGVVDAKESKEPAVAPSSSSALSPVAAAPASSSSSAPAPAASSAAAMSSASVAASSAPAVKKPRQILKAKRKAKPVKQQDADETESDSDEEDKAAERRMRQDVMDVDTFREALGPVLRDVIVTPGYQGSMTDWLIRETKVQLQLSKTFAQSGKGRMSVNVADFYHSLAARAIFSEHGPASLGRLQKEVAASHPERKNHSTITDKDVKTASQQLKVLQRDAKKRSENRQEDLEDFAEEVRANEKKRKAKKQGGESVQKPRTA